MEEQKMNEKESLELIAQMIRVTKQSIGSGSGNKFLMYGYTATILSIVIYALVYFTGNSAWSAGWFLMFLPFLVSSVREKRNRPKVVTYTDRMINETWRVIGALFVLTVLTMIVLGFVIGRVNFGLMMPLALARRGLGVMSGMRATAGLRYIIIKMRTMAIIATIPAMLLLWKNSGINGNATAETNVPTRIYGMRLPIFVCLP